MMRRGVSQRTDSKFSSHDRRKRSGAAERMATAGAMLTTFCRAVSTPSEAAAKLIVVPATTDHGVNSKASTGRRKNP
jgi:hypothetical protein